MDTKEGRYERLGDHGEDEEATWGQHGSERSLRDQGKYDKNPRSDFST